MPLTPRPPPLTFYALQGRRPQAYLLLYPRTISYPGAGTVGLSNGQLDSARRRSLSSLASLSAPLHTAASFATPGPFIQAGDGIFVSRAIDLLVFVLSSFSHLVSSFHLSESRSTRDSSSGLSAEMHPITITDTCGTARKRESRCGEFVDSDLTSATQGKARGARRDAKVGMDVREGGT